MRICLLVSLAMLVAACGRAHKTAKPGATKLVVQQIVNHGSPIPIEGSYSYVRIEDGDGHKVTEERLSSHGDAAIQLDPGSYRLVSYQRTCDGNCGNLDPPSDSCSGGFTASSQGSLSANVNVTFGSGCKITFASMPSP
jgi:hypothetical protein